VDKLAERVPAELIERYQSLKATFG
jgi:hypothetical protein